MVRFRTLRHPQRPRFSQTSRRGSPDVVRVLRKERGSALLEFAITLPLLVVFVVGIYDFGGAFNQKQKIEQAAQEGAIVAAAQPMSDIAQSSSGTVSNPDSLQVVVTAIVKSLTDSGVLPNGSQPPCRAPFTPSAQTGLTWTYTIDGCSGTGDQLLITIDRGWVCASGPACTSGPPVSVGTKVTVANPYHWRFNSAIQLLFSGANYTPTTLTENAGVQNQT